MKYEIQFARVTNSGKLNDRFLACQRLEPSSITITSKGKAFSLIEILSPWFSSAQIGQAITNNFSQTYFQGGSTSDLVNFENSLKNINEHLGQITQNGETEWIGNLNGILAVIAENNLHLAPTGKNEAYIFRDGKANHLTYGLNNKNELHPLKTFINVVSGQLKSKDKVLITNKNLFDHLSLESVRQIVALNNASDAAGQIAKLLRKAKVKNVNLIIIDIFLREELSEDILAQEPETVFYLDKSSGSFMDKTKQAWQSVVLPIGKIIGSKTGKMISSSRDKIKEKSLKYRKTKEGSLDTKPSFKEEKMPEKPQDRFHREFLSEDDRDDHLLKDEEIQYSPELYVHYYKEKKTQKESKLKNILSFIWAKIKALARWLLATYRDKNRRKYLFIGLAIILILIIILVASARSKGNQVSNLEAQKILDEAISAQKDGQGLLSSGSKEKAKDQFLVAIEKAQSIQDTGQVAKDAQEVISVSFDELDKLTSTTRFNELEPIVELPKKAKSLFIISGESVLVTENDIYKANILTGKSDKVATIPQNKGEFIAGTVLGKTLYIYTSNQSLFEFDVSSEKLEQVKVSSDDGRWETANSIASYIGSIYLLDGVLGQIYKHSSSNEAFDEGAEYLTGNTKALNDAVSLAIDGNIYVLKNDGQAISFQRSKQQDFSLSNIPTPNDKILNPQKIYTDSDTPSIYILDSEQKRILEFDKEGVFIRQYAFPESFEAITDFVVSVKSKKIWLLSDNSLYEINI